VAGSESGHSVTSATTIVGTAPTVSELCPECAQPRRVGTCDDHPEHRHTALFEIGQDGASRCSLDILLLGAAHGSVPHPAIRSAYGSHARIVG